VFVYRAAGGDWLLM